MAYNIRDAVDGVIKKAFDFNKVSGSESAKAIGNLTLIYKNKLNPNSRFKTVIDLSSYINNKVIELLQAVEYIDTSPTSGKMVVLDPAKRIGKCLNTDREVEFISNYPCVKGEVFPYRRVGSTFYLDNYFKGNVRTPNEFADTGQGNFLIQFGETCKEIQDLTGYKLPWGWHRQYLTAEYSYPNEQVWYKYKDEAFYLTYVQAGVYKERKISKSDADIEFEVDISSYLSSGSSGVTPTIPGVKSGSYVLEASKVVRITHWRHIAILQVMTEQRTVLEAADDSDKCYWPLAIGEQVKSYSTVSLFSLIMINTVTGDTNELNCLSDFSSWFSLYPVSITAGYTDIQICKETGHILLVKSSSSPSTTTLSVDYFKTAEYVNRVNNNNGTPEDPSDDFIEETTVVCDNLDSNLMHIDNNDLNDTYEEMPFYPVDDTSTSASIPYATFTMYAAKIDETALDFTDLVSKYSTGSISTLQGASVSGGCRGLVFTQCPEAPFDIFLKVHRVGYANANYDYKYKPSTADPSEDERDELWFRGVVCLGMLEMVDLTGTIHYSIPTTDLGTYNTLSPDSYTTEQLSSMVTFNRSAASVKMFGLRILWPDLEGNAGKPDAWVELEENFGRTDLPVTKPYFTTLVSTRFGNDQAAIGVSKPYTYTPAFTNPELIVSPTGESDSIRNDPDNFTAWTNTGDTILFLLACQVEHISGRYIHDDWAYYWNTNSTAQDSFALLQSYAKYRAGINQNMLNLLPFPDGRWPDGTDGLVYSFFASGEHAYLGFSFISTLRCSDQTLFFYLGREYIEQTWDYDVLIYTKRTIFTALGFIGAEEEYRYTPNILYPDEWVCMWTGISPGPGESEEVDGDLKLTSLGHRQIIKDFASLTASALP